MGRAQPEKEVLERTGRRSPRARPGQPVSGSQPLAGPHVLAGARAPVLPPAWPSAQPDSPDELDRLRHLVDLQDRDRQLVGFEIHDGLAQLLAGAKMQLGAFRRLLEQGDSRAAWGDFEAGMQLVEQSLQEARRLIQGLGSEALEDGLVAAVENLVYQSGGVPSEPRIDFQHDLGDVRLPPPLEHTVFRVVQEGYVNACRHSRSGRLRIALRRQAARLEIEIQDWGVGFDPTALTPGHFGLEGMRERARLFGGTATITSAPGKGTLIAVQIPLGPVD